MIEGADANASVTGQQNTQPVTIRLLGNIQMPNNKEYSADGCFVVGKSGVISPASAGLSGRKSISCVLKNGKHVDMEFDGHVSFQGKGGVRGKPVMRNGMIVGYAGAAGLCQVLVKASNLPPHHPSASVPLPMSVPVCLSRALEAEPVRRPTR
jgi:conjugal transfer pilus assembly protein TraB